MKIQPVLGAIALAVTAFFGNPVLAQTTSDTAKAGMAATPGLTSGEVRKIDKEAGKITIRHGEIKHLDMPAMTMVFQVRDPAQLGKLKAGDQIQFSADKVNGAYTVIDLKAAP